MSLVLKSGPAASLSSSAPQVSDDRHNREVRVVTLLVQEVIQRFSQIGRLKRVPAANQLGGFHTLASQQ